MHPLLRYGTARVQHEFFRQRLPGLRDFYDAVPEKPDMDRFTRIAQNKAIVAEKNRIFKMREYVGRRVILLKDLKTNGGTEFKAGEVLVVYGHWRGMLNMDDPDNPKRSIRKVHRRNVEVLDG